VCNIFARRLSRYLANRLLQLATEKIYGLARLCDVIYVLCEQSLRVLAFSADTYQRLPDTDIKLSQLQHPADMVACQLYQRLYIADCPDANPGCVWQVFALVTRTAASKYSKCNCRVI